MKLINNLIHTLDFISAGFYYHALDRKLKITPKRIPKSSVIKNYTKLMFGCLCSFLLLCIWLRDYEIYSKFLAVLELAEIND